MKFTILGAGGFIGRNLAAHLKSKNYRCDTICRGDIIARNNNLGVLVYCVGLTADFRKYPLETIEAHICYLKEILKDYAFDKIIYLSSSRVYLGGVSTAEGAMLNCNPIEKHYLYNLSKLMGESLCLNVDPDSTILRLSNVYGMDYESDNFLPSIIKSAIKKKSVEFLSSPDSEKDFISIDDVINLIEKIAISKESGVFNLASGVNIRNCEIASHLNRLTGCEIKYSKRTYVQKFNNIDNQKVTNKFNFKFKNLIDELPGLVEQYREAMK